MKKFVAILIFLLVGVGLQAQLKQKIENIISSDSAMVAHNAPISPDSAEIKKLQEQLSAAKLTQANTQMELEQLKIRSVASDSIKLAQQKQRIDSLRRSNKGVPVVVEGDTLFHIYTNRGGYTALARAQMDENAITTLGKQLQLNVDSLIVTNSDVTSDVMYKGRVIVSVTENDALWANMSRHALAVKTCNIIKAKIEKMHQMYGVWEIVKHVGYFILVLIGWFILLKLTILLYKKSKVWISKLEGTKLKTFAIQNLNILDTKRQVYLLTLLAKFICGFLILVEFVVTIPLLFSIFPQTKFLTYEILSYIWNPIKDITKSIIGYIPNLFTIIIICTIVHYVIKGIHYLAQVVQTGQLKISGFYPDWAIPTYTIVRFLLYAFMIAMIYPYLPGSHSGIFQGISVFVGIIVSLGSTAVIGNIIAGFVITYMRQFKVGDCIKLNDIVGYVTEKTAFVIRLRTHKNEVITVPNSSIISSNIVNYTESAQDYGLIIHTEVTIGYDAPWREVNQLLINAALATKGIESIPPPYVLETSLSDFYPVYQINAFVKDATRVPKIYSDLHQNIQDMFNDAGVEIMSPHYTAFRNGNKTTIPDDDLSSKMPPPKSPVPPQAPPVKEAMDDTDPDPEP